MEEISVQDALDVFALDAGFVLDDLKLAYRTTALRVHPDKGGSEELFQTVNECFRILTMEHKNRTGGSLHDQLKRDFEADVGNYAGHGSSILSKDKFDVARFNQVFETTQVEDPVKDGGYGSWLESDQDLKRSAKPKINPKAGTEAFNRAFEQSVPFEAQQRAIVVRPVDLTCGSSLWLSELGVDAVEDYTTSLAFDCRLAHTTQRLADPSISEFSSNHRAMTPAQIESQRASDLSRGLSMDEAELLKREDEKQARLDSLRREREMQKHGRFANAHAAANRALLGSGIPN